MANKTAYRAKFKKGTDQLYFAPYFFMGKNGRVTVDSQGDPKFIEDKFAEIEKSNDSSKTLNSQNGKRLANGNFEHVNSGWGSSTMRVDTATSSMTSGKPDGDGYILTLFWDNTLANDVQLYVPSTPRGNKGRLQIRYRDAGDTWGGWQNLAVTDADNAAKFAGQGPEYWMAKPDVVDNVYQLHVALAESAENSAKLAGQPASYWMPKPNVVGNAFEMTVTKAENADYAETAGYVVNPVSKNKVNVGDKNTPVYFLNGIAYAGNPLAVDNVYGFLNRGVLGAGPYAHESGDGGIPLNSSGAFIGALAWSDDEHYITATVGKTDNYSQGLWFASGNNTTPNDITLVASRMTRTGNIGLLQLTVILNPRTKATLLQNEFPRYIVKSISSATKLTVDTKMEPAMAKTMMINTTFSGCIGSGRFQYTGTATCYVDVSSNGTITITSTERFKDWAVIQHPYVTYIPVMFY